MLTRFKVQGFKNLADVEVHFGPFTCIAGANGVGKSNLFDAIRFLSALADLPLVEAAQKVREGKVRYRDIEGLFYRIGDEKRDTIRFEADIIIPDSGEDDLGGKVEATITFLTYTLELKYRPDRLGLEALEISHEELKYYTQREAKEHLRFPNKPNWRSSVVKGRRSSAPFISTELDQNQTVIKLHQDKNSGKPSPRFASNLPRTVLSSINTAEYPTAMLARREMQSWTILQLEPSVLRQPNELTAPAELGANGENLAAVLYFLAQKQGNEVYTKISNKLAELLEDLDNVWVDRDEQRRLLTIMIRMRDGTEHPARSLSDGTLRFLALAIILYYPQSSNVICFEEPENGIHPSRIRAMLTLLEQIAMRTDLELGDDNPLRQIIINTHSPAIVQLVPEDSLLGVKLQHSIYQGRSSRTALFCGLRDTWRANLNSQTISAGDLLSYLNAGVSTELEEHISGNESHNKSLPRVGERHDVQKWKQLNLNLFHSE